VASTLSSQVFEYFQYFSKKQRWKIRYRNRMRFEEVTIGLPRIQLFGGQILSDFLDFQEDL
jgi:hypothetical protein